MCRRIWFHATLMILLEGTGIALVCVYAPKLPLTSSLDTNSLEFILIVGGSALFVTSILYGCFVACFCLRPTLQQIHAVTAQMNAEVAAAQRRVRGYQDAVV